MGKMIGYNAGYHWPEMVPLIVCTVVATAMENYKWQHQFWEPF